MHSSRLSPVAGRIAAVCAAAALLIHPLNTLASPAGAPTPPIAVVLVVTGDASLQRAEHREPIIAGMPLLPGDRVSVLSGSVALMLADASLAELIAADVELLSDAAVRLQRGTLGLSVRAPGVRQRPTLRAVHGALGTVLFDDPADVVVVVDPMSSRGGDLWAAVTSGKATVAGEDAVTLTEGQSVKIMDGKTATMLPTPQSSFDRMRQGLTTVRANFGPAPADVTDRLPAVLRSYALLFARTGDWKHRGTIDVWYPHVAADWQPFQNGRWLDVPTIGWTWAAADMLPITHYGRWNRDDAGKWFWIPGAEWQAAPVAWRHSSEYVGWSPLTEKNTPVANGWTYMVAAYPQADVMPRRLSSPLAIDIRTRLIGGPPARIAGDRDPVVAQRVEAAGATAATELRRALDRFTYGQFSRTLATRPAGAPAPAPATAAATPAPAPAPVAVPVAPVAAPVAEPVAVPSEPPPAPQVIVVEPPPVVVEVPVERERPRHESRDDRPRSDPPAAPAPARTPPKQETKDDAKDDSKSTSDAKAPPRTPPASGGAVRRRPE